MFKLKTNLLFFRIVLFIGLGFFLIINNHQVMAMNNLNDENSINNEINKLYLERKELAAKISYFDIYHLDDDIKLKTKLHNLDQTIKNLYQRLADVKNLKCINEKIWDYSYEQNQIANTILSR
ncbi:MAG: SVM family protein, partial [Candidatus Phytoplasma sp. TWB_XP]